MKGHIQQRGKSSWRLKFDAGRDEKTGKRKTQFHTFRGTKRQAQVNLAELIASVAQAKYVEPHKITVAEWVRARVDHWEASGDISARTAQRYRPTGRAPDRAAHRCEIASETPHARRRGMAHDFADKRAGAREGRSLSPNHWPCSLRSRKGAARGPRKTSWSSRTSSRMNRHQRSTTRKW